MPAYNGVFAAVHVDGKPLDEYQVQENDTQKEVSCWIPSQVGKEFSISYKNSSLDKHMGFKVLIDGYQATFIHAPPQGQGTVGGFDISTTEVRPFIFSEGKLVDDDDFQGEVQSLDNLGAITVAFHELHGKPTNDITTNNSWRPSGSAIPEQRPIPERGKKGIQTCVALGPVKVIKPFKRAQFNYTNNVTRVIFRYRPLDYLQAQGIAPPPPPPAQPRPAFPPPQSVTTTNKRKRTDGTGSQASTSEAKRVQTERKKSADVDISNDEDIKELQILRAQIDKILAKRNARVKKEIKAEPTVGFLEGEVIDLT